MTSPSRYNYGADLPAPVRRHFPDHRALHAEYLSLVGIVRNGVDVGKKQRTEGVRVRLEGILHSADAVQDGSARVLRAALNKADKQRAALQAEERRVSRARKKMRQIEDKILYFHADEQTQELHKERVTMSHNRMQTYYALRSQLKVERAVGTLKREIDAIADLLGSLIEKCDQTKLTSRMRVIGAQMGTSIRNEEDPDDMSLVSFDDSTEDGEVESESSSSDGERIRPIRNNDGDEVESRYRDADEDEDELDNDLLYGQSAREQAQVQAQAQEKQLKVQRNRSLGRSFRVIRPRMHVQSNYDQSQSRLMRLMFASRTSTHRSGSVERMATGTATISTDDLMSERSAARSSMIGAVRNSMRFTMAKMKATGKLKRGWLLADERYAMILSLAPHFMEERLVPLGSIEGGLLGEWPQRKRSERFTVQDRFESMLDKVEEAVRVVTGMERWQRELVGTIRTDYRKHRGNLRKLETELSEMYVKQLTDKSTPVRRSNG